MDPFPRPPGHPPETIHIRYNEHLCTLIRPPSYYLLMRSASTQLTAVTTGAAFSLYYIRKFSDNVALTIDVDPTVYHLVDEGTVLTYVPHDASKPLPTLDPPVQFCRAVANAKEEERIAEEKRLAEEAAARAEARRLAHRQWEEEFEDGEEGEAGEEREGEASEEDEEEDEFREFEGGVTVAEIWLSKDGEGQFDAYGNRY